MRKYLLVYILFILPLYSLSQTSITLATGTLPVVPAGWSIGGSATAPAPVVQLTPPAGGQAGRVWYATPQNLTGCGSFTVEFDFQIIPNPSSWAIADGMAFWIVNPLSGFVGGGGIGLPTNPNGLVLILDSYDNDGVPNDPLVSLYGYPAGFTGTYVEGVAANRISSLSNQTYVSDGGWHHVKITYSAGNINVYLNYSSVPNMTGFFLIGTTGYFGFCGSTGGASSTQSIRNVYITFGTSSPIFGPDVLCLGTTGAYVDSASGGTWSSSNTAVATINTSGIVTPVAAGTTTISYAYGSGCVATKVVTVNPTVLASIAGSSTICSSSIDTFSNTTAGGTWSSSSSSIATIGSTTGIFTPVTAGVVTITYTHSSTCFTTRTVTINTAPPPLSISPLSASVCNNGSLTLTAAGASTYNLFPLQGWESGVPTTSGIPINSWSYNGAASSRWYQIDGTMATLPTIGAAYAGTNVAIFNCRSLPAGSVATLSSPSFSMVGVNTATLSFWVYRDMSAFTGAAYNTEGLTVYVNTSASVGGATTLGFVPRSGIAAITGSLTGTSAPGVSGWYQYTCTIPAFYTGATNYVIISGNSQNGNNIYLDNVSLTATISAPTWSPFTWLYNNAALTIPYTGAAINPVYMHPVGFTAPATIAYTVTTSNGVCGSTGSTVVTINPNPASITGTSVICIGSSVTLSSATPGGSWSSSNAAVVTVGATSGVITGTGVGTATISYAFGGCATSIVVTVVASPGAITGTNIACLGATTTLSNPVAGGTWSSSNPAVGSVNSTAGVVSGLSVGTTTITYGIATCFSTITVSVNVVPTPITGSLGVCVGATTALASTPAGGFWFSGSIPVATIGVISGIATGVSPGTSLISYVRAGCSTITTLNVVSTPGPIVGTLSTCSGSTTNLSHGTPGGTWSSSNTAVATVGATTGVVTGVAVAGGTATITYTVSAGCFTTAIVTVTATPVAPSGTFSFCVGSTTIVLHPTPGGTWSTACPGIATVGLGTGIVSGVGAGTCVVTYSLPSGCRATATLTVLPLPAPITGLLTFCQGITSTLSSATPGGAWTSGNPVVASIVSGTGVATGNTAGTSGITYTSAGGCVTTAIVTVTPVPTAITGTATVCVGSTTTLSTTTSPVAWSSSNTAIATVSGTGVVTGITPGTATITAVSVGGCTTTRVVTVTPTPAAITGSLTLCVGLTTTLSSTTTGGTWSVSPTTVATLLSPGFIGGNSAGTATVVYTAGGCSTSAVVTVSAAPGTISGTLTVCIGNNTTLSATPAGGTWSTPSGNISINATTGVATGITAGTASVTYALGSGCNSTTIVTVTPLPNPILGTLTVCEGSSTALTGSPAGGTWTSGTTAVATIAASGVVTGVTSGTSTISYTLGTGCQRTADVTVNPLPAAITGSTSACVGQTTTLSTTSTGGAWSSSNTAVATVGAGTGIVSGLTSGTANIIYTLPTGCQRSTVVLINPLPTAITGTLQVCAGSTTTAVGSPAGGTWSVACPGIATIGLGSGIVSGISAGTCEVTYTMGAGGCQLTNVVTVNPLPAAITGTLSTCVGTTTTLSTTTTGGAWSSSNPAIATIDAAGMVTGIAAGTANITYTLPTGCRTTTTVTINPLPGLIIGSPVVCVGNTSTLSSTPTGGTWASSLPGTALINTTTGVVNGLSAGTTTITYTLGTGCIRTTTVTVNPLPNPITGTAATCVGNSTTLTGTPAGGAWAINPTTVATITTGGVVTGSNAGTATVSYTLTTGCRITEVVTVYALPANITGTMSVCQGATTVLSTTTAGGTWASSNTAIATVDGTGTVSGVLTGSTTAATATITYSLGTGCIRTATVTVNPLPAAITGTLQVCAGLTTTVSNTTTGGTWSSSTPSVATINTAGTITGVTAGTSTITYTITGTGCTSTAVVTVNGLPAAISGPSVVCVNNSITLSSTPAGGIWSTADATISINTTTGDVLGVSGGTARVTYTVGTGCITTTTITVNALPNTITGTPQVCVGSTTTLSTTSTGGVWSSTNPTAATISSAGVVSGLVAGTTIVSYTFTTTGCASTVNVVVNQLPTPILGSDGFCNFTSTFYTSSPAGGAWSSSDTSILIIDPSTGLATGRLEDTAIITYTLPTGCSVDKSVFLILAPLPVGGPDNVCFGSTITMTNGIGGGVWSSSNPGVAPITPVTPTTANVLGAAVGTSTITYVLSTGCQSTKNITVNPIPAGVTGSLQVCEGLTTTLGNVTPGGTWASSDTATAVIDASTGVATGRVTGTSTITYALGTGCNAQVILTVNPLPAVITGFRQVCEGLTTNMSSATSGGIWSVGDPGVAYIDPSTGVATGLSAATPGTGGAAGITVVTYTLPATGCIRSQSFTVNPLPSPITGLMNVCEGAITVLSNATPGGTWVSSNPAIATVDASGVVNGIAAGSVIISYVLPTSCIATWPMNVNANPTPIGGSLTVCAGFATNLTSGPSGGTWSSDPMASPYGTIHSITGVVSGISGGLVPVTYTLGSGCRTTETVTVITLPAVVSGTPQVCVGSTTVMSHPIAGGSWSISNPSRASINATTGVVTGISAGTAVVTYTVGTGCFNVHTITVNALPAAITGTSFTVCRGSQIVLNSSPTGFWNSGATAVATVVSAGPTTGIVTGVSAGTAEITFTISSTGCIGRAVVTVNATPDPIPQSPHVCIGNPVLFTNPSPGGTWISTNPAVATVGNTTGLVIPISLGTTNISYVYPITGCAAVKAVTVQPLPVVYTVTGGGSYCAGGNGVHIGLSNSQPGVSYVLYRGSIATGYLAGTGFALDFGLLTTAGTYTIQATNATSGCTQNMAGSAVVIINPLTPPTVSIAATPTDSVCPGETVTLNPVPVNGGTAPTYVWKVNGVTVGTGNSYSFIPANGDVASVTMTSNGTCISTPTATGTKTLTVLPDATPVAGVLVSPNDTVCQFNPVTFTAAPTYGGAAPTYRWFVDGSFKGTGDTYTFIPEDGEVVTCELTSNYRCRLATTVTSTGVVMSVDSVLIPTVSIYPEPGLVTVAGSPVTLIAVASNAGPDPLYQWKKNGTPISGATSDRYTGTFADYDSISCVVTSSGVCANIGTHDWVFITVFPLSVQPTTTAMDVKLIPNPNKGAFSIKGSIGSNTTGDLEVEVTNMLGQVVYRGTVKANQGRVDTGIQLDNTLANGMYLLTLHHGTERKVFHFVMEQ